MGKSFFDFVYSYQIANAKKRLLGGAKPILNTTYDVGLNFFVHTPFLVMQAVTPLFAIENFGFGCSPYLNSHFTAIGWASIIANQQG